MARVSDELALMNACSARERGVRVSPNDAVGEPEFDSRTYQIAFQLRNADAPGGSVEFNWAQRDGTWKIVSFDLLTD
jgi:hypothetical protein